MGRAALRTLASALAFGASLVCVGPASAQILTHADGNDVIKNTAFASDASGAIDRARKAVAAGDLAAAVNGLTTYVAAHPSELAPARYLGDLHYRAGDLGAAERTYLAVLRFAPADRETHDRLGGVYAAQDRVADAIGQFQQSLPESSAYAHLVDLHRRAGDLAHFEAQFRATADNGPSDAGAQYALGTILRAEHRPGDAAPYLERALALDARSCPVLSELGSTYLDLGRTGDAEHVLARCLAIEPDDYPALVNLGDVEVQTGRVDAAHATFAHANRLRPDGSESLIDLGYLEDLAGHWQPAVNLYLRAIGADPLARDAYVDLGYDYEQHRLYALAEAAFLKGLSVSPDDGRLHYLLGVTYADQGKRELARTEYRRAASSDEPAVARAASTVLTSLQ